MADKTISELPAATSINPADLFVLQQQATNSSRSLQGQVLVAWLTQYADGHGGIQNIAKTSTSGLVDTYTITYADGTVGTFTVTNGAKGDTGDQTYVWIKWAAQEPTADNQLSDNPDKWIGIYTGLSSNAPTSYTAYTWYEYKGEKGDQGDAISSVVKTSGTGEPGTTDTYTMYVGEQSIGTFDVYNGLNGSGAVNTVNGVTPDVSGNVNAVPTGGSLGQALLKSSGSDFAMAWGNVANRYDSARFTGAIQDINISPYQTAGGYAFLLVVQNWITFNDSSAIYLVSGIASGQYQGILEIAKGGHPPQSVAITNTTTIRVTYYNSAGGYYSIIPLMMGAG